MKEYPEETIAVKVCDESSHDLNEPKINPRYDPEMPKRRYDIPTLERDNLQGMERTTRL